MKNRKGQITIGIFITVAVALIVGLVLLNDAIAPNVGAMTTTRTTVNNTITSFSTETTLNGYYAYNMLMTNATSGAIVNADNYTITNKKVDADGGMISATIKPAGQSVWNSTKVNISYSYYPDDYVDDSASRTIITLIVVFSALAIAVIALSPTLRSGLIERFG